MRYLVLQTKDISEDTANKKEPGIYEGKFAVQLPIGCKYYLIKLGRSSSSKEITYAYFKGE